MPSIISRRSGEFGKALPSQSQPFAENRELPRRTLTSRSCGNKARFAQHAVLWSNQPYPRRASEFSAVFEWRKRQRGYWVNPTSAATQVPARAGELATSTPPAVSSSRVEKLRKSAMSGR